jgi:Uncharacterised nucleotidyltransferase
MKQGENLVAQALREPPVTAGWSGSVWSTVVQQARKAGLLARLAQRLQDSAVQAHWPAGVQGHFDAALRVSRAQQAEIRRELVFVQDALKGLAAPVVLLKGAAYVMGQLPAASGRVFGDIDFLVPKATLGQVETQLMLSGWMSSHQSAYDQRYYRQWMQELPPLQNVHRGTVLDVHHAILPETARVRPDPAKLFERIVPVAGHAGLFVLGPEDMVLHSMTHLFFNDDTNYALRDLSDLDLLMRHFLPSPDFFGKLVARALELNLTRPLYYGLRMTAKLMGTPIPTEVTSATERFAPAVPLRGAMNAIWHRALRSRHPSADVLGTWAALSALYLRGHWLRMPPVMLAKHLTIKALHLYEKEEPANTKAAI